MKHITIFEIHIFQLLSNNRLLAAVGNIMFKAWNFTSFLIVHNFYVGIGQTWTGLAKLGRVNDEQ